VAMTMPVMRGNTVSKSAARISMGLAPDEQQVQPANLDH
jgi:hypothetical protein